MVSKFRIEGNKIVPEKSLSKWALWFQNADRVIAKTSLAGYSVSTVFLGVDYSLGITGVGDANKPILFETMVFYKDMEVSGFTTRDATWEDAIKNHALAVERVTGQIARGLLTTDSKFIMSGNGKASKSNSRTRRSGRGT